VDRGQPLTPRGAAPAAWRLGLPSLRGTLNGIIGFVMLVGAWWGAVVLFDMRPVILPSPLAVGHELLRLFASPDFARDVSTSLVEVAWGYALGAVTGIASGAAIAQFRSVRNFLEPQIELFRFVIPFSLVPLVVVWFGVSSIGKIFVVWYACYFVIAINTAAGIANVDPLILKAGRMVGVTGAKLTLQVVLPAALPRVMTGLQLALASAWISVIAAEYVGAQAGLGYFITNAQLGLETTKVLAGMIVIGAIGALFSVVLSAIGRWLTPHEPAAGW
jgi:NitT/TauT family transport system permease protein